MLCLAQNIADSGRESYRYVRKLGRTCPVSRVAFRLQETAYLSQSNAGMNNFARIVDTDLEILTKLYQTKVFS